MMLSEKSKIVLIGTGNVGTQLAQSFAERHINFKQLAGRTFSKMDADADLYIIAVKDDAIANVVARMPETMGIVVHTAGSVDLTDLSAKFTRYGVFYPLQTFSKNRKLDFSEIPVLIEAGDEQTLSGLKSFASILTKNVGMATSERRRMLHLSAVFACNFVNHLYALAEDIVQKSGFDIDILKPLIIETAQKVQQMKPVEAQTGPAVRYDKTVMAKHLALLQNDKTKQQIYALLSENIHTFNR